MAEDIKEKNSLYSSNLYEEIISLKEKNIFLISNNFEDKIPEILSYILSECSITTLENKIQIIKIFKRFIYEYRF